MKISVIIPVFNEENQIQDCLASLEKQTVRDLEIIVVDDGSIDNSIQKIEKFPVKLLKQSHKGPGEARNLGANIARGEILVFVDADMTFRSDFIKKLTQPIVEEKAIGTFSKDEYVLNKDNVWSKCWNLNKNLPLDRMHGDDYPDTQDVFRAILKSSFIKAGGFDPIGYIDDYTISKKLGQKAICAPGSVFYHKNPESINEVFIQARWIGKSEYKERKIKNQYLMRIFSIIRYSLPFSILRGILGSIKLGDFRYLVFKIIFDFGIEVSLIKSFFKEQINK